MANATRELRGGKIVEKMERFPSKGAPNCDLDFLKQLRLDYTSPRPALVPETR
jgi:hypothetical protein